MAIKIKTQNNLGWKIATNKDIITIHHDSFVVATKVNKCFFKANRNQHIRHIVESLISRAKNINKDESNVFLTKLLKRFSKQRCKE